MILLFDIDGTLLSCGGAGRRSLERAFVDVLGREGSLHGVRLAGSTDLQIIEDGLRVAFERPLEPEDPVELLLERYLECLGDELAGDAPGYQVFDGATELLDVLSADGRFVLGLATGNVERGARLKLDRGGLGRYFDFGGFGSDAKQRGALVRRGVERGLEKAGARGLPLGREHVWVLGDTGKDVEAAKEAGVQAIGVLAGSHHHDELHQAGPAFVVESLGSASFWDWLGLSSSNPQRTKT